MSNFRLKSMRNYRGLTLEVAAKKLGMTRQNLHRKEEGEEGIKFAEFLRIAESYQFKMIGFPEEQIKLDHESFDFL